jgi:hypothetical protein
VVGLADIVADSPERANGRGLGFGLREAVQGGALARAMHARTQALAIQSRGVAMASELGTPALGVGGDDGLRFTAACDGGLLLVHIKGQQGPRASLGFVQWRGKAWAVLAVQGDPLR